MPNSITQLLSRSRKLIRDGLSTRLIVDREPKPSPLDFGTVCYDYSLHREELARHHIFAREGTGLTFLDVGGRDGELSYLFGVRKNLEFDAALYSENQRRFAEKFVYYGLDLAPSDSSTMLTGDVCDDSFPTRYPQFTGFFDVIYSNNVFEHLRRPWIAAANLYRMMKPGGLCITIAPFSLRYHEVPGDYFRYTHTAIPALFADAGPIETVVSGYDITGRRNNWQGLGTYNDTCPVDRFGAWRENWFVVTILRKPVGA